MRSSKEKKFKDWMENNVEEPLCGLKSPLGAFAEAMTFWTEKEYPEGLPPGTTMKCWCCAFWRGVTVGLAIGFIITAFM